MNTSAAHIPRPDQAPAPSAAIAPARRGFAALAGDIRSRLSAEATVRSDEPLARRTTLNVGGAADLYVEPAGESDLSHVRRFCRDHAVPFRVVGRGSNLLVRDGGVRGVVVCLAQDAFTRVDALGDRVRAGAGARLKQVAIAARRGSLSGFEFLEGIPGSVGGGLRMNAGAHASWIFDIVETVRFMNPDGETQDCPAAEVSARYRSCPHFVEHIALAAVFRGRAGEEAAIRARMDELSRRRCETQPRQPSAGCIFKNPDRIPAGRLIDLLGLKGRQIGGAQISTVHANFMVNVGGATARDFLDLIELVRGHAHDAEGIELETEVEILGED